MKPTFAILLATFAWADVAAAQALAPTAPGAHAPRWDDTQSDYSASVGSKLTITLRATDEDVAPLTYNVSGLPAGAHAEPGEGCVVVTWEPGPNDLGVYPITATVSDGEHKISRDLRVVVEDEHDSYFMPGGGYSVFVPNGASSLGVFMGGRVEILPAAWIHMNDKRGPSHGRIYLAFDVLTSLKTGIHDAFLPSFGFDLSLERNPARRWLVPYFGLETGAWFQLDTGTLAFFEPLAGVHLYASQNVYTSLTAGYFLPLSSEHFDEARGLRGRFTIDFSLW